MDEITALGHPTATFGRNLKIASTITKRISAESIDERSLVQIQVGPHGPADGGSVGIS
jgi:hypothetical protein